MYVYWMCILYYSVFIKIITDRKKTLINNNNLCTYTNWINIDDQPNKSKQILKYMYTYFFFFYIWFSQIKK